MEPKRGTLECLFSAIVMGGGEDDVSYRVVALDYVYGGNVTVADFAYGYGESADAAHHKAIAKHLANSLAYSINRQILPIGVLFAQEDMEVVRTEAQPDVILKTRAEVQSGSDRQKWAEGLILQLPHYHNGRCSWLLNYGVSDEAVGLREERGLSSQWSDRHHAVVYTAGRAG